MSFSNTIQVAVSGYFLAKEIVNYVAVKNVLKGLAVQFRKIWEETGIDFLLLKLGLMKILPAVPFVKLNV